jgi:uncharacterized protein DUF4241
LRRDRIGAFLLVGILALLWAATRRDNGAYRGGNAVPLEERVARPPEGKCLELMPSPAGCPYAKRSGDRDFGSFFEAGGDCVTPGRLRVSSGGVLATDPLVNLIVGPFKRSVPNGDYPVYLAFDHEESAFSFALLQLGASRPVRWQEEGTLALVDSGTSCFVDGATAREVDRRDSADAKPSLLDVMYQAGFEKQRWANLCVDPETGANLIAFQSGVGDGSYPSYWGLDERGALVALVTDFRIVDLGEGRHPWLEALRPSPR